MDDRDLDDLLALAAANRPAPDAGLYARVLADAQAVQPGPAVPSVPVQGSIDLWQRLSLAFGGGAVLAGVTSTLLLGLVIGYLSPTTLDYLTGGAAEAVELFPDTGFVTTEG